MAHGLPLIVRNDGGGLPWFVEDGVTGFDVEPTGRPMAKAITKLRDDRALAADMGRETLERANRFTWENAFTEVRRGVERVVGAP
jgi:glycosyltransferase involved in cell wall biosynthesis